MNHLPPDIQRKLLDYDVEIGKLKAAILSNTLNEHDKARCLQAIKQLAVEKRKLRCEYDVLFFMYEYFSDDRNPDNEDNLVPEGTKYEDAPAIHHELCNKLNELNSKPTKKICQSMPRGHAKSAILSNAFPIHQIVFKKRRYIIIISETEGMSRRFVEWISGQLKHNKKLRADYGVLLHENKMANESDNLEGFITLSNIKVQAASMGKQLRGSRHGSVRPDCIIGDDLESSKNTNTPQLRERNLHWYNSVVQPMGDPARTCFVYMGTLVHAGGLLPAILQRSDYDSAIYSAIVSEPERQDLWEHVEKILRDVENPNREYEADKFYYENKEEMDRGARTLWNERFTYYELMKIKINIGSKAFASEYLNKPSDEESCIFKKDMFTFYKESDLNEKLKQNQLELYGFWDIAIGKNQRSDYNAIVIVGRDRYNQTLSVVDCWASKVPMHEAKRQVMKMIRHWKPRVFGIETIQAQYEMYRQVRQECMEEGLFSTRIMAINPKGKKEERIESLEPLVESGFLRFNRGHRLLLEQMEMFPGADHDDCVDALASAVNLAGSQRKKSYYKKPKGL